MPPPLSPSIERWTITKSKRNIEKERKGKGGVCVFFLGGGWGPRDFYVFFLEGLTPLSWWFFSFSFYTFFSILTSIYHFLVTKFGRPTRLWGGKLTSIFTGRLTSYPDGKFCHFFRFRNKLVKIILLRGSRRGEIDPTVGAVYWVGAGGLDWGLTRQPTAKLMIWILW